MKRRLAILCALAFAGCAGPQKAFVDGMRAAHAAVAPEYLRYVENDANLTEEQRASRRTTVSMWDRVIAAAEKQHAE